MPRRVITTDLADRARYLHDIEGKSWDEAGAAIGGFTGQATQRRAMMRPPPTPPNVNATDAAQSLSAFVSTQPDDVQQMVAHDLARVAHIDQLLANTKGEVPASLLNTQRLYAQQVVALCEARRREATDDAGASHASVVAELTAQATEIRRAA